MEVTGLLLVHGDTRAPRVHPWERAARGGTGDARAGRAVRGPAPGGRQAWPPSGGQRLWWMPLFSRWCPRAAHLATSQLRMLQLCSGASKARAPGCLRFKEGPTLLLLRMDVLHCASLPVPQPAWPCGEELWWACTARQQPWEAPAGTGSSDCRLDQGPAPGHQQLEQATAFLP